MSLTPRQRVHAVLDREPVDRLPVDIWFTGEVYEDLCRHTGADNDIDLYRSLGVDKILWTPTLYTGPRAEPEVPGGQVTEWGAQMKPVRSGAATYMEMASCPLRAYEETADLDDYPWWPDVDRYDIQGMADFVTAHAGEFALLGPWTAVFEIYCHLRGQEQAFFDLIEKPDYVEAVCDRLEHIQLSMLERLLRQTGDRISMLFLSDDMGTQNGPSMSPVMWAEHFAPRVRRWSDLGRKYGVRLFYHSDGGIRPLLPGLIEAGVDVLNPVQHNCPGMELESLKKEFGERLLFHGGVDTQKALPFGTVDDVRAETENCLRTLGAGGLGYICGSCHNIQAGTPVENILAMIETARSVTFT